MKAPASKLFTKFDKPRVAGYHTRVVKPEKRQYIRSIGLLAMLRNQDVTKVWLEDPLTLESVLVAIANGASLVEICEGKELVYSLVVKWFTDDPVRKEMYELAIESGKDRMRKEVLHEIRALSMSNMQDAFDEHGNMKMLHTMPDHVGKAVKQILVRRGKDGKDEISLKFTDKVKALELLGKELGMFKNTTQIEAGESLAGLIEDSMPVIDAEATVKDKDEDEEPPKLSA